jgi:hypothetical protein
MENHRPSAITTRARLGERSPSLRQIAVLAPGAGSAGGQLDGAPAMTGLVIAGTELSEIAVRRC